MNIQFKPATLDHQETIFKWLELPHVKEFWDNSPEHRADILNFMEGRKELSPYFGGVFSYWVGSLEGEDYCLILTSPFEDWTGRELSTKGKTFTLDFMIGNEKYLGKGLASSTLVAFMAFFQKEIEPETSLFFIDPWEKNAKAIHVYEKAGFRLRGHYLVEEGFFKGNTNLMMIRSHKKFS